MSAAASTDRAVTVDVADHVATIEIHRPPHNWFDIGVMTELADAVLGVDDVPECRAVVLCSEGKNFCAGADLKGSDLLDATTTLYEQAARLFSNRKPIVAAVQGAAVGGGLGLSLAADFRVASPETRFTCNFAKLGFHQGFGISATLPAVVGPAARARARCTPRSTCVVKRHCASGSPTGWSPPTSCDRPRTRSRRRSRRRRRSRCSRSARRCVVTSPTGCAPRPPREP